MITNAALSGPRRAWAALGQQQATDLLTGYRSPLGWDDEPEPVFLEVCAALGVTPWPVHGRFPHTIPAADLIEDSVPPVVVAELVPAPGVDDAPTVALRLVAS